MRSQPRSGHLLAGIALMTCLMIGAGHAQIDSREGIILRNQIDQLRHDLQTLQDQTGSHGGGSSLGRAPAYAPSSPPNDLLAQLLTRVDALEDQVRQLRGRIDETQNQLQRQGADLSKRMDDLEFQMQPQPGQPPAAGQPVAAKPPVAPPVKRTPEVALQEANAALARRDYPVAEQAAREVMTSKGSPRVYDAHLVLAQALYGERKYDEAALAYDDAYKASKKGAHAQDALLGLANAFIAIKQKDAACQTLGKLRTEFPQPRADLKDGIASVKQRGGCP
jgi:TolA-binding protein